MKLSLETKWDSLLNLQRDLCINFSKNIKLNTRRSFLPRERLLLKDGKFTMKTKRKS
jgi:hypothetical protein